jgi:hypothetical protein
MIYQLDLRFLPTVLYVSMIYLLDLRFLPTVLYLSMIYLLDLNTTLWEEILNLIGKS